MTTITVNERTKAGKSFLEFAKNLPFVKINENSEHSKPFALGNTLLKDFETACMQLKDSRRNKIKRKSLDELLNEK